jgi:hypothetical protein
VTRRTVSSASVIRSVSCKEAAASGNESSMSNQQATPSRPGDSAPAPVPKRWSSGAAPCWQRSQKK